MRKASVLTLMLTVFIDLVGFGIVLPLLPLFSKAFSASGWQIGLIIASYSLMQFIFSPIWGRVSDRIGRRPILLISTSAACASYVIFALGSGIGGRSGLLVLLLSRLVAGACGANITVAQAYIADITPPEKRSARMGLIGMAFGLGFVFGPALGGIALKYFNMTGPGWVAAGLCALNFVFALIFLPESRSADASRVAGRPHWDQWRHSLSHPRIGLLIGVFFLSTFCFTCYETTLGLLVSHNFHLNLFNEHDTSRISYLFAYTGLLGALVQGGATGRLVKILGEPRLIVISLLFVCASFGLLPFVRGWSGLLFGLGLLAIGASMTRPPVFGMISMLAGSHEQGATLGVAQGMGSLSRIIGPVFAGTLFGFMPSLPYLICGALLAVTALLVWILLARGEPVVNEAEGPTELRS